MRSSIPFKVASANLNQTILNFTRNIPLIESAIDKAVEDNADILCLQELGLTGYSGDDNFRWIRTDKQQKEILELVKHVADYAKNKNPNLLISLGFPLFYADKSQPVRINVGTDEKPALVLNPLYNINNRPFNAQTLISGGKIQSISLKSIQPDGAGEYESRQFTPWHDFLPVQDIDLPFFGKVKAGNPVTQLTGKTGETVNLYHEICAEGWPGINDDGTVNHKEVTEGRHLVHVTKNCDISLVINPSASKPEVHLNKPDLRANLANIGSEICNGAGYVYTNCLGSESGSMAFEGGSIYSEKGKVIHRSRRYSMADLVYSSCVMELPVARKGIPDVTTSHKFSNHDKKNKVGGADKFELGKDDFSRHAEETIRNTALWIRDYLKKSGMQGFVVSLSGGADSAFGAVMITEAIDLNIQQLEEVLGDKKKAVASFINQFPMLDYRQEVLETIDNVGAIEAIKMIKKRMLTCVYLPSDNSNRDVTGVAARTLIEGGMVNGKPVEGIGGEFKVIDVQASVDTLVEAFAGVVHQDILNKYIEDPDGGGKVSLLARVRQEFKEYVSEQRTEFSKEVEAAINEKSPANRLSWRNKSDDITLQNIQARARVPYPWMIANKENKIACVTSNWSEAISGYWTYGGDGHMGSINLCGGVPKSELRLILKFLEEKGMSGQNPIKSLHYINAQTPTAELRKSKLGEAPQSDENDMMPYVVLDSIGEKIFIDKNDPSSAYEKLRGSKTFSETASEFLVNCIDKVCSLFRKSQFKRTGSSKSPFLGRDVDPHTSLRTTLLGDGLETGVAQLKLKYLSEKLGSSFKDQTGSTLEEVEHLSKVDERVRQAISNTPLEDLPQAIRNIRGLATDAKPFFIAA